MSRFTRIASFTVDPEQRDAVLAAYGAYASEVAADDDVIAWEIGSDAENRNVLHIVATFPGVEAYERHMSADATAAVMAVLQPALVGTPSFFQLDAHHVA